MICSPFLGQHESMSKDSSLPKHVAIIIDGNRRWAKAHGLKPQEGHARGAEVVEEISRVAVDAGIKYLTIWGGSYNNLTKRTPTEIKFLDEYMYRPWAQRGLKNRDIYENEICVRLIGEWPILLSKKTRDAIQELEGATRKHSRHFLTYLIGYNGDREMVSAMNSAIKDGKKVTGETIKNYLWTKDLPQVDLVIRTGAEDPTVPHNSTGFMMWHTKDAILHFAKKNWPDFTKEDFLGLIKQYSQRERRFGK